MRNSISDETRKLIIKNYNEGAKPKQIAQFHKVNVVSVYKILEEYKKSGRICKLKKGGDRR
jgi:transposase